MRRSVRITSVPEDGYLLVLAPPFLREAVSRCPAQSVALRALWNGAMVSKREEK